MNAAPFLHCTSSTLDAAATGKHYRLPVAATVAVLSTTITSYSTNLLWIGVLIRFIHLTQCRLTARPPGSRGEAHGVAQR